MLEISICAVRHIIFLQDKCAVFHVPKLDQKKTINHVTAWERKQSSDIQLSPHPSPPAAPRAPGRLQVSLFFPQPLGFQHNFWRPTASGEKGGTEGRGRRRLDLTGGQEASGAGPGPLVGVLLGPLPVTARGGGVVRVWRWALPWTQSDKKRCLAASPLRPLPRPPQPCLSAGSQVITNPWRGAEAEHLPERHGDDE